MTPGYRVDRCSQCKKVDLVLHQRRNMELESLPKGCYCDACIKYYKSMFKQYLNYLQNVILEVLKFTTIANQFKAKRRKQVAYFAYFAQATIMEVFKPKHLKELAMERVEELKLVCSEEDLPATLRREVEEWPATRQAVLRENVKIMVEAAMHIQVCYAENYLIDL